MSEKEILEMEESFVFTSCEGYQLVADPDTINLLHHGNFGTTKEHYKNPDKNVILRDANGLLVRVTKVNLTLDEAWQVYQASMEKHFAKQNS